MKTKIVYIADGSRLPKCAFLAILVEAEDVAQPDDGGPQAGDVMLAQFGSNHILASDPDYWGNDSIKAAHLHLQAQFATAKAGDTVDVTTLGESV